MQSADDESVWDYAKTDDFVIVSKDADFHQRSFLYGASPKVVWIALGNCSTTDIENLLRTGYSQLVEFGRDPEAAFLALGKSTGG